MKKQKYRIQKDLTLLTGSLFIIVAVWVSFAIYHTHVTSTISDVLQIRIEPITGRFDTTTIQKLKTRTQVLPEFSNPLGTESAVPEITPLTSPEPTETPVPAEPTPEELPDDSQLPAEPTLEEAAP